jgi:aspartyl-tRNA(Asn)/glutamyl-tRNA(Gln) amidotransferase subunit B
MGDVSAYANSQGLSVYETHITPAQIAGIVDLVADGTISSKIAKDLLQIIITEDKTGDPAELVERRGMKQVTDLGAIEKVVDEIIAANPDQVAKVREKPTLIGWFVGQAMKASGGKANPQALNEILRKKLGLE